MLDELNTKSAALKTAVTDSGNMYDHIYYFVAVNLVRVKKALDKLPGDFLEKVQAQIASDISEDKTKKAIQTIGEVLGYSGAGLGVTSGIIKLVIKLRARKVSGDEPPEPTTGPFEDIPLDDTEPIIPPESESSFPRSPKLTKFAKGLDIGGVVFGVAGLATTIGLGIWTLEKLKKAISDVEKKQKQVDAFKKAMTDALDLLLKDSGLPKKSYVGLTEMAATWKKISENFDGYEKSLYYAIQGYFLKKSLDDIKATVAKQSDPGKPFPDDGYPLAEALAGDIKYLFSLKKTDKEIVAFFATENPKIGLRFVFTEFFISTLRWF